MTYPLRLPLCFLLVLAGCDGDGGAGGGPSGSDAALEDAGTRADGGSAPDAEVDGGSDAGAAPDAGSDAGLDAGLDAGPTDGPPITAPERVWTWVPTDGAVCANGEPTGFMVSLVPASPNLMIYFGGGGACWDFESCYEEDLAVAIVDGVGPIATEDAPTDGLLDRDFPDSPVATWSLAFVPYCTGDVHAGSRVADHDGRTTHHVGHLNTARYLARLRATLPSVDRVLLTGSSAGGFGATFNYAQTQERFTGARVDVLNDGGAMLPEGGVAAGRLAQWRAAWGLDAQAPTDCPACLTDLSAYYSLPVRRDARSRVGLMSHSIDDVLVFYFDVPAATFEARLRAARTERFDPEPRLGLYSPDEVGHTFWGELPESTIGEVTAFEWVTAMLSDDPDWVSLP